ncbi:organic cation transporter protein-like isoform X2 [Littorina saxatilis]|uniref:organic cation transporter protein-like isoform X2 n=1 Tax=Littorina saxatilis TaxID=31220 RepID=UPI0038B5ADE4
MKFDDVLREIGEFGWYQRRVYLLACLPIIFSSFETMSSVFILNIPAHRCAIPGYPHDHYHVTNETHAALLNQSIPSENGQWSKCNVYSDVIFDVRKNASDVTRMTSVEEGIGNVSYNRAAVSKCQRWVFDHSVFESTIATDFSLVCDRSVFRSTSNVVAEIGTLIGTGVSGLAADRFGRKLPFYIGALALMSGGFGIAFTTNFIVLNFCRFLIGLARMTLWVNGLVIGMEIVGPSKRVFAGTFIELVWCVGAFLLLLFAYFIRNWRYLEIAVSVPSCVLLAYWWLIPESPRWLASKGREKEVLLILEKIASSNKTKLPDVDDVSKSLVEKQVYAERHLLRLNVQYNQSVRRYLHQLPDHRGFGDDRSSFALLSPGSSRPEVRHLCLYTHRGRSVRGFRCSRSCQCARLGSCRFVHGWPLLRMHGVFHHLYLRGRTLSHRHSSFSDGCRRHHCTVRKHCRPLHSRRGHFGGRKIGQCPATDRHGRSCPGGWVFRSLAARDHGHEAARDS